MSYPIRAVCISQNHVLIGRASDITVFDVSCRNHASRCFHQNSDEPINAVKEICPGLFVLTFGRSFKLLTRKTSCGKSLETLDNLNFDELGGKYFCKHWIIDVCAPSSLELRDTVDSPEFILLLLSQNLVIKFDLITNQCVSIWQCENPCILYSGLLIRAENHIAVFAGTVFNSTLFWTFPSHSSCTHAVLPHKAEFVGHDGVIFSLDYSEKYGKLVSGSDDRSVRIWQFVSPSITSLVETETPKIIQNSISFFCHAARVQRVKFFGERIISVGEDCLVCVLSFEAVLAKFSAHKGINIFGLAVSNDDNFFITCGEDGAVLKWDRESLEIEGMTVVKSGDPKFEVRLVKFLSSQMLLYLTTMGELILEKYSTGNDSLDCELLDAFPVLENYSVWSVDTASKLVVFGSLYGDIIIYSLESKFQTHLKLNIPSKVNSAFFVGNCSILCSVANQLVLLDIREHPELSLVETCSFNWPITNNNWPTCVCSIGANQNIACGDRNGTVWVFAYPCKKSDYLQKGIEACQVLTRCHSKVGVTDLVFFNKHLYTAGRDGKINVYSESQGSLQLMTSLLLPGSISWVTKLVFHNGDLVAFCFKSDSLVLFDIKNSRVLSSHHCGGGHRSFDLLIDKNEFYFAFLKKSTLSVVQGSIHAGTPYDVLLPSLHGSKIHCMDSVEVNGSYYVITGSEDCSVKISSVDTENKFLTAVQSINLSPCAVRFLQLQKISGDIHLLFIAGSRSFKALYQISFNDRSSVSFKKLAHETTVLKKHLDDCKYLSGDVRQFRDKLFLVLGSSAGFISFYVLNCANLLDGNLRFSDCPNGSETICTKKAKLTALNVVRLFPHDSDDGILFLVGDNYGFIILLKLNTCCKLTKMLHLDLSSDLGRITTIDISYDVILVGGDSGSVTLVKLINQSELSKSDVISGIHCAQITSSKILSSNEKLFDFATVSIDQRMKVWKQDDALDILETTRTFKNVAAANGFVGESQYCVNPKWCKVFDKSGGIEDVSCSSLLNAQVMLVAGQGVGIVVLDRG